MRVSIEQLRFIIVLEADLYGEDNNKINENILDKLYPDYDFFLIGHN